MLIELLINVCTGIIKFVFGFFSLPEMPPQIQTTFDTYFSYIFDNLDFLNFFFNVDTLKTVSTIAILLYGFKYVYKIIMWVIKKIPLSID